VTAEQAVDLVIVGGGAMGLATAWHAAAPGRRVVVLERFRLGHDRGASHGGERIFRHAHTDRAYVDMALAADEGWQRLERDSGRRLIHRVGCVEHGALAEPDALARVAAGAGVTVERLTRREAERRWPSLRFAGDTLFQPDGGWVAAADALDVLAAEASRRGAHLLPDSPVSGIEVTPDGDVRVRTPACEFVAPVAVVTPGAWAVGLLPDVGLPPLTTTEEQVFYFEPAAAADRTIPSFIHWDVVTHYGLPAPGGLVKLAQHHTGAVTTGDDRTFVVDPARRRQVMDYAARWVPGLAPNVVDEGTCLYTSTPSLDFVLDRVGPLVVGCGFSGLGFKYVPEVGRRLAGLAAGAQGTAPFSLASHADR
jgi:sarcosine oxidase